VGPLPLIPVAASAYRRRRPGGRRGGRHRQAGHLRPWDGNGTASGWHFRESSGHSGGSDADIRSARHRI